MAKRITGTLPAPTLEQRIKSLCTSDLMVAARGLAHDEKQDALCSALLAELETRVGFEFVEMFAAEIYA